MLNTKRGGSQRVALSLFFSLKKAIIPFSHAGKFSLSSKEENLHYNGGGVAVQHSNDVVSHLTGLFWPEQYPAVRTARIWSSARITIRFYHQVFVCAPYSNASLCGSVNTPLNWVIKSLFHVCPFSGDARACLCGGEFYLCELVSVCFWSLCTFS